MSLRHILQISGSKEELTGNLKRNQMAIQRDEDEHYTLSFRNDQQVYHETVTNGNPASLKSLTVDGDVTVYGKLGVGVKPDIDAQFALKLPEKNETGDVELHFLEYESEFENQPFNGQIILRANSDRESNHFYIPVYAEVKK